MAPEDTGIPPNSQQTWSRNPKAPVPRAVLVLFLRPARGDVCKAPWIKPKGSSWPAELIHPTEKPIKGRVAHRRLQPRQGSADLPPGACSLLGARQAELRSEESKVDTERAPRRASPEPGSPWSGRSRCALARETVSDLPGRLEGSGKFCAVFRGKQVLFGHQRLRGAQNEVEC